MTRLRAAAIHDPCKNLVSQNYICIEHNDYLSQSRTSGSRLRGTAGPKQQCLMLHRSMARLRACRAAVGKQKESAEHHEQQDWNVARADDPRTTGTGGGAHR